MAYFTKMNVNDIRELTPSEAQSRDDYIAAQVLAGTTDGILYEWPYNLNPETGQMEYQRVRMWSTLESANGFKDVYGGFTPSIAVQVY